MIYPDLANPTAAMSPDLSQGPEEVFSFPIVVYPRDVVIDLPFDVPPTIGQQGDDGDNIFVGVGTPDIYDGRAGDDFIDGKGGGDTLRGGAGDDTIYYRSSGVDQTDRAYGGAGDDTIAKSARPSFSEPSTYSAEIYGGRGNDDISGSSGSDAVYGGRGGDTISGGVEGFAQADLLAGGRGEDRISAGIGDTAYGGRGDDTITARVADSGIYNGTGSIMYGGPGSDHIIGGIGDDVMKGGEGADTFVFVDNVDKSDPFFLFPLDEGDNSGLNFFVDYLLDKIEVLDYREGFDAFVMNDHIVDHDVIRDFTIGVDMIEIIETGVTGLDDLEILDTADGAVIRTPDHEILLEGVNAADLGQSITVTTPSEDLFG